MASPADKEEHQPREERPLLFRKSSSSQVLKTSTSLSIVPIPHTNAAGPKMAVDDQETLVSLFGSLYKMHGSTGSLVEICEDKKPRIFLVNPEGIKADEWEDEHDFALAVQNIVVPAPIKRTGTKRTATLKKIRENEESVGVPAPRPVGISARPEEENSLSLSVFEDTPVLLREALQKLGSPMNEAVERPSLETAIQSWISHGSLCYAPTVKSEYASLISSKNASIYRDGSVYMHDKEQKAQQASDTSSSPTPVQNLRKANTVTDRRKPFEEAVVKEASSVPLGKDTVAAKEKTASGRSLDRASSLPTPHKPE
ncbi:hypothetical protein HDV03_003514 [Kappamyces sp. JEL0829]|nr:hypothetical protein HDV03_003514 [Kappamyces sp. JEL0829]